MHSLYGSVTVAEPRTREEAWKSLRFPVPRPLVRRVQSPEDMSTAESVVRPHPQNPHERTDRRVHARVPLAGPVLVDALSGWQRARCENISAGGLSLDCDAPLPLGKRVELYFELPSGVAIETHALVVRSRETKVAMRFVDLDPSAEVALRNHCRTASLM